MMLEFSEILTKYVKIFSEICTQDRRDSSDGSDIDSPVHSNEKNASSGSTRHSLHSVYLTNVLASTKRLLQLINFGIGDSFDDKWEESWQDFENYLPTDDTGRESIDLSKDECFQEFQRVADEVNREPHEEIPRIITGPSFAELESIIPQSKDSPGKTRSKKEGRGRNRTSVVMFAEGSSVNLFQDSLEHSPCKSSGSREMEEERKWFFSTPPNSSSSETEMSDPPSFIDSLVGIDQPSSQEVKKKREEMAISCDGYGAAKSLLTESFDFFRAYFTLRKIRQLEESGDTDDPLFDDCSDLGSPVLKRCEQIGEHVSHGISDVIRSWMFVRRINQLEDSLEQECELKKELNIIRDEGFELGERSGSFDLGKLLRDTHMEKADRSELFDVSSEPDYELSDMMNDSREENQEMGWEW